MPDIGPPRMETIGRYEIIRELGRGAMGVVYRARDPKIDREVAIKTIKLTDKADSSELEGLRERLVREAQSAGKLSHPNIVTVYDVDEIDDIAFIAMELVEGRTLEDDLKQGRISDYSLMQSVLQQAAAALDYAHSKGIIHRDVKPGNLMLAAEGVVKIMDFGIARIGSSNLTQTGSVLGTPSYMSPEQVKGDEIDGRSDQFSLAVIAYEMLTGQKPFPGENLTSVIFKIVSKEPTPIEELAPDVPAAISAVVRQALSKEPTDRFDDCKAFAGAFEEASSDLAAAPVDGTREIAAVASAKPPEASGTEETQVNLLKTQEGPNPNESAKLPPLKRTPPVFNSEDPKKRWGSRIAVGLAAAALFVGVGFAVVNPWVLDDPLGNLGAAFSLLTGGEATVDPEPVRKASRELAKTPPPPLPAPVVEASPAEEEQEQAESKPAPKPEKAIETPAAVPKAVAKAAPKPTPSTPKPAAKRPASPKVKSVSVYFRTNQRGAKIAVDDRPDWTCETPCRIAGLPPGSHTVTAKLEGFHSARRLLQLGANEQEVVEINLEDARITALITSEPSGGEIYIDGRKIPQKTNAKVPLARGTYRVKVVKEGVGEAEQVVVVDKDQIPYAKFVLGQAQ